MKENNNRFKFKGEWTNIETGDNMILEPRWDDDMGYNISIVFTDPEKEDYSGKIYLTQHSNPLMGHVSQSDFPSFPLRTQVVLNENRNSLLIHETSYIRL